MKSKHLLLIAGLTAFSTMYAQAQHSLTKLWETEASLPVPESVLYNKAGKSLFVAQIDGKPSEKDGKGGIAKVGLDGKIIKQDWVTGLNAPKGMGMVGNSLFVADVTEVVEINIKTGAIIKKHQVEGAKFLNDVSVDKKGNVYISDMEAGKILMLQKGQISTVASGLTRPNGVLAVGTSLLILDAGTLKEKNGADIKVLAEGMDKSTDGIEQVKPGEYIISCWAGVVYYYSSKGLEKLLDTSADKINSADIGYDPMNKVVYVPTFAKNSVVAYQLK